jgi:hypothetical protein
MNQKAILFHLREAQEELDSMIAKIEKDTSYDTGLFRVAISHVYHHLNTAWNGRGSSAQRHRKCAQGDFDTWRKFPPYSELFLE